MATLEVRPSVFEQRAKEVDELVEKFHLTLTHDRLLLAIHYHPMMAYDDDVRIFEVFQKYNFQEVDPERKMSEVYYGPTKAFPLNENQNLRITLTNPKEFEVACRERWNEIRELRSAKVIGKYRVIWQAPKQGQKLLRLLEESEAS